MQLFILRLYLDVLREKLIWVIKGIPLSILCIWCLFCEVEWIGMVMRFYEWVLGLWFPMLDLFHGSNMGMRGGIHMIMTQDQIMKPNLLNDLVNFCRIESQKGRLSLHIENKIEKISQCGQISRKWTLKSLHLRLIKKRNIDKEWDQYSQPREN